MNNAWHMNFSLEQDNALFREHMHMFYIALTSAQISLTLSKHSSPESLFIRSLLEH